MENYITVSQINNYIRGVFEAESMLQNIFVFGEVSSYNISNGIAYFNIKDENSLLQCVLFGALKFKSPNIGDMVLLKGGVNYYAKGGRLSFNAVSIQPYGKGLLYEKFLELKNKLEQKGYFAVERKKSIPERVKRIGVITSASGAVIQDIIDVTRRRNNSVDIVLYPVKVQGVGAEHEIAEGINFFSSYDKIDVIIVARGGGSIEDLAPFNTEIVANAVYDCKKPLVSAVGHETDYTIIDFISDLRAPTPSAAAELVVWSKLQEINDIFEAINRIIKLVQYKCVSKGIDIKANLEKMCQFITNKLDYSYYNVQKNFTLISSMLEKKIVNKEYLVSSYKQFISKISPFSLAKSGYIRVINGDKIIKSINDVNVGEVLQCEFLDGKLITQITEKIKGVNHE